MPTLPPEILYEILGYSIAIQDPPIKTLMTICCVFHEICQGVLYTSLLFSSLPALGSFVNAHKDLSSRSPRLKRYRSPRSIIFNIEHHADHLVFSNIHTLFSQCFQQLDTFSDNTIIVEEVENDGESRLSDRDDQGRLVLDLLQLRMDTHASQADSDKVYDSLSLANPRSFVWTGRDPPHHLSIAIVPAALDGLRRILGGYTHLTHLKLTNLSISFRPASSMILPVMPSLRTLYLGQVIHIDPFDVCEFILHPSMVATLESVTLVDAYKGSIWGTRLRRSDLESLISSPPLHQLRFQGKLDDHRMMAEHGWMDPDQSSDSKEERLDFIRRTVVCRAKTERIMGGDRVEEDAILI